MPDVQGSRTLHTLVHSASTKAVKLHRSTLGYCAMALAIGAIAVFSVPDLRAQALAAHRAVVATAKPEVKQSVIVEGAQATEVKVAQAAAQVTPGTKLHELQQYIGLKYKVPTQAVKSLVDTAWEVGGAMKMDPLLLLAVMAIESSFNPRAESHMGAQGLMQVMTRIHHKKFEPFGGKKAAWKPDANINVGAQILKDCIAQRGSVAGGLTCYVGSPGINSQYGRKVLAERKRLEATLAPGALDGLMLASAQPASKTQAKTPAKLAAKDEPTSEAKRADKPVAKEEAPVVAKAQTVDEHAADIVARNRDSGSVALNEVTASLTLRADGVEM